ncbi:MAG: SsgA family sporulation/cell division regulator [Actinomycetota bacterium]
MSQAPLSMMDDLQVRLVAPGIHGLSIMATLRYQTNDPFAVRATFHAGTDAISWVLGRDLLADGLLVERGEGDVRVWPAVEDDQQMVMLELSSPDGRAVLAASAGELEAFLARTYDVVPLGYEGDHIDVDGAIDRFLADS